MFTFCAPLLQLGCVTYPHSPQAQPRQNQVTQEESLPDPEKVVRGDFVFVLEPICFSSLLPCALFVSFLLIISQLFLPTLTQTNAYGPASQSPSLPSWTLQSG